MKEIRKKIRELLLESLSFSSYPLKKRKNYNIGLRGKTHNLDFVEQVYVPEIKKYVNLIDHSVLEEIAKEAYEERDADRIFMIPRFRSVVDIGCNYYFYTATSPSSIQISGTKDYQEDEAPGLETEFLIFYSKRKLNNESDFEDEILIRPPDSTTKNESEQIHYERAKTKWKNFGSIKGCDFREHWINGNNLANKPKKREGEMISPESPPMEPQEKPVESGLNLDPYVVDKVKPYKSPFRTSIDKAKKFKGD